MNIQVTYIGTATMILEIGSTRILTDPALDPAGSKYSFGFGTGSSKLSDPHLPEGGLRKIDTVLLSHDQHGDNLDLSGRAFLNQVGSCITTVSGARRLGAPALGLVPWESIEIPALGVGKGGAPGMIRVTATPARHGPPLSLPIVGAVIGFILEWPGQEQGAIYISGDTVMFAGISEIAKRFRVGTAFLHLGSVCFGLTGRLKYTFSGRQAALAARTFGAQTILPLHYEGWTHFHEGRRDAERAFAEAGLTSKVRWLQPGVPENLDV